MSINLDQAIAKMQTTGDWEYEEDTQWSDKDIVDFERDTSLQIPERLVEVLKRYGWNGFCRPDRNALFVAVFEDGTRSVHEVQILVSPQEDIRQECSPNDHIPE